MKKSTLIMILSLVLAVALGVGGTLAYLQDTDEDVNVMTLGNVHIDQIELERDENGELQQFTQGKPLYPAVYDGYAWDPENVKWPDVSETADSKVFDDEKMSNVIDKFVFVKNTGNSDAYVRTIMAFELGSYDIEKVLASDTPLIHLNVNDKNTSETGKGHWDFKWLDEIVTIDSNNYALVEAVYLHKNSVQGTPEEGILPAGATSYPSLLQLFMDKSAKNEDIEAIDGNKNGTYDILVVSQAVQTQGFADAKTALDTAFGPITAENNPWKKGGEDIDGTPVFPDLNAPVIPETNWLDDGKADTTWYDAAATEYELSTAAELAGFAKLVNEGTNFNGKTVKLAADIDLKDNCWTPIGQTGTSYGAVGHFAGNFDGQGHTIKNLFIQETNDGKNYAVGLFGFIDAPSTGKTIGNFTIDGANIKGHHWVGAAVGYLTGTLENVTVKNAVISSTHANDDACGDKTGAVVGYINGTEGKMINCSAIDSTVTSGRDAGQVVGSAKASQVVDCTATNVTVTATGDCTGANVRNEVIGRLN